MPQGWGDSQPCTDFGRIDVSDAQVGTKKRALRSNQETDEGKLRRPGQLLDKENPVQGPWCRFRREARARERHAAEVLDSDIVLAVPHRSDLPPSSARWLEVWFGAHCASVVCLLDKNKFVS